MSPPSKRLGSLFPQVGEGVRGKSGLSEHKGRRGRLHSHCGSRGPFPHTIFRVRVLLGLAFLGGGYAVSAHWRAVLLWRCAFRDGGAFSEGALACACAASGPPAGIGAGPVFAARYRRWRKRPCGAPCADVGRQPGGSQPFRCCRGGGRGVAFSVVAVLLRLHEAGGDLCAPGGLLRHWVAALFAGGRFGTQRNGAVFGAVPLAVGRRFRLVPAFGARPGRFGAFPGRRCPSIAPSKKPGIPSGLTGCIASWLL